MRKDSDSVRLNLYVSPKYLEYFDEFADDMHLTRSAAFTVLIRDYMRLSQAQEQIDTAKEMLRLYKEQKESLGEAVPIT